MNTKDAEDWSTIIRSAPCALNASDLLPRPLERSLNLSRPTCSPCGEGNGSNLPDGDLLAVLLAAADQIGWLGRDTLRPSCPTMQGKSKSKATTTGAELAQKRRNTTRPPRMRDSSIRRSKLRRRVWKGSARSSTAHRSQFCFPHHEVRVHEFEQIVIFPA